MENILESYKGFAGKGLMTALFVVCLVILFFREKDRVKRIMFIYFPGMVMLFYFCPLSDVLLSSFSGDGRNWRVLWLLPFSAVVGYTAVETVMSFSGKKRWISGCLAALLIVLCGGFIYADEDIAPAENVYHVPNAVVAIADAIYCPGREVSAAFPGDLIIYVRQYTPYICMPYGREVFMENFYGDDLFTAIEADILDAEKITSMAKERKVIYIITKNDKPISGSFEECDFEICFTYENYNVYKNSLADLATYH